MKMNTLRIGDFTWVKVSNSTCVEENGKYAISKGSNGHYKIYELAEGNTNFISGRNIYVHGNIYRYTGFWNNDFESAAEFVENVIHEQIKLF